MGDGKKIKLGAGDDFEMYHMAGENTYFVESGEGATVFKASGFYFQNTADPAVTTLQIVPDGGLITTGYGTFSGNLAVTNGNITTGLGATLGGVRYSGPSGYYSFITRNSTNAWTLSLLGTDGDPANDAIGTDIFSVTYSGNATFAGYSDRT